MPGSKPFHLDANEVGALVVKALKYGGVAAAVYLVQSLAGLDWGPYAIFAAPVATWLVSFLKQFSMDTRQ